MRDTRSKTTSMLIASLAAIGVMAMPLHARMPTIEDTHHKRSSKTKEQLLSKAALKRQRKAERAMKNQARIDHDKNQ